MAADPFVRHVFDGATLARSVEGELNSLATPEGLDMVIRWRARALIEMLNAGSAERARAAFARVEPNTTGPLAEEDEIRPRGGSAGSPASGERRTRTVQECSWDTGYEFVPGEGEAQRVEKFVCRDREIEE